MIKFTIKGDPRSKKNSQRIVMAGKYPKILPSKAYCEYEEVAMWQVPRSIFVNYPCNVQCKYYMQTRRKVDLVNLQEATLDILVKARMLADDNCQIVKSMNGSCVEYDKKNPRVEITITEVQDENR